MAHDVAYRGPEYIYGSAEHVNCILIQANSLSHTHRHTSNDTEECAHVHTHTHIQTLRPFSPIAALSLYLSLFL